MQISRLFTRYSVFILLTVVVLLAYWPVYRNGFVYDDAQYVTGNPHVQHGLTWTEVRWSLTSIYASNWHPLTWISHMADVALYDLNPAGHHVTNLILHLANVLLLFVLLSRMTGSMWPSAFVAMLFGIHPLHVESVAWISERKDVLSTFFGLLTMLAYARYARTPGLKWYALVVGLLILSLASKPMLVTLPFVLLLMDFWPLERTKKQGIAWLMIEKLPLLILSVGSCAITYYAQRQGGAMISADIYPLGVRIQNALVAYSAYIGKMLWPTKLAVLYPHPGNSLPLWMAAASAIGLAVITLLVIRVRRPRPYLTVGWLWYVGTLIPVIGIVQVGDQAMADRYTYVPLIGLFVALTWGVADLLVVGDHGKKKKGQRSVVAPAMACTVVGILAILTRLQVPYWQDDYALFEHALAVTKNNGIAHNNFGAALQDIDVSEAIAHYREALRIRPNDYLAHNNLGSALGKQGLLDQAISEFKLAIKYNPRAHESYDGLGNALIRKGDLNGALLNMEKAVEINPEYAEGHNNLGLVLDAMHQENQAIPHFEKAISIAPYYASGHYNYAVCLNRLGRNDEAIEQYRMTVELDPTFGQAHKNLAVLLYFAGDYKDAWREARLAEENGSQSHPGFLQALSEKMPEPSP